MSVKQDERERIAKELVSAFLRKFKKESLNFYEAERRTGISSVTFSNWLNKRIPKRLSLSIEQKLREYIAAPESPFDGQAYRSAAVRVAKLGERNPRWTGGSSKYPNHAELKRVRLEVLRAAGGNCSVCHRPAEVVHHIDGDKSNHATENLTALCKRCHWAVHAGDGQCGLTARTSKFTIKYGGTVRELAESVNLSPSVVYGFLCGRRRFTPEVLRKLEQIKPLEAKQK